MCGLMSIGLKKDAEKDISRYIDVNEKRKLIEKNYKDRKVSDNKTREETIELQEKLRSLNLDKTKKIERLRLLLTDSD
jgi:hypothetical protein